MADQQARIEILANASQAKAEVDSFAGRVRAAADGVKTSFAGIASGVSGMQGQVKGHLGSVGGIIEAVQSRFIALAAVLAGGAVLKEAVSATVDFTKEAMALSRALGINTTEAAALNVALGDVYADADAMIGAADKLAKQLRTNEAALTGMGIKTRDASGNLRNMKDLMLDTITVVNGYREGTDRTLALQTAFGKGADDVSKLLKLNAAAVEEAKNKQAELGLVVGVENVEATKRYRAVLNDVGDVLLAVKKAIGDAVLPMLTQLGEWFVSIGPAAVTVIKGAVGGLVATFWALQNGVNAVWQVLDSFVFTISEPLLSLGTALYRIVQGDFKGATEIMMTWPDRIGQRWSAAWNDIADSSVKAREKIIQLFSGQTPIDNKPPGGKTFTGGGGDQNRVPEWSNALAKQKEVFAAMKAEQGAFIEMSLSDESRYWSGILERADLSAKERLAVESKVHAANTAIRRQAAAAMLAEKQVAIEAARNDFAEQSSLMASYVETVGRMYGLDSREYQQALRGQLQMKRDHEAKLREIDNIRRGIGTQERLETIADEERAAELQRALGLINQQQLLEIRARTIEQRREIELAAKLAELDAEKGGINDPVRVEALQSEIAAIKRRYRGLSEDNSKEQRKVQQGGPLDSIFGASQQAIQQGLDSMVARFRLTSAGIRDVARQIGSTMVTELVTKPMAAWIAGGARKVAMAWLFGQQEVAASATAGAEKVAIEGSVSLSVIAMRAYQAAAGAYAAIAAIPYVGPVLAPVAAGVALAGAIAFAKNIFSAEGGFDIPKGMNPLVQAHSNEMMLPSKHADTIRMLGDLHLQGGLGNGGGGGGTFNINALDSRSFERMLKGRQGDELVRAIAQRVRNRTVG